MIDTDIDLFLFIFFFFKLTKTDLLNRGDFLKFPSSDSKGLFSARDLVDKVLLSVDDCIGVEAWLSEVKERLDSCLIVFETVLFSKTLFLLEFVLLSITSKKKTNRTEIE